MIRGIDGPNRQVMPKGDRRPTGRSIFVFVFVVGAFCLVGCSGKSTPGGADQSRSLPPIESDEDEATSSDSERNEAVAPEDLSLEPGGQEKSDKDLDEFEPAESVMDPADLRDATLTALEDGDDELAYQTARRLMRIDPSNVDNQYIMALVYGHRRRFAEAIDMLDAVAELKPEARLPSLGQTADWLVRAGNWSEAENRYREILVHAPNSVMPLRNLAKLMSREGRRIEASKLWFKLCEVGDITEFELRSMLTLVRPYPADAERLEGEVIGMIGHVRNEMAQGRLSEARKRLEALQQRSAEEQALLARVYAESGEAKSLVEITNKLGENSERYADAWYARGTAAVEMGDYAAAVESFSRCVLMNHTDVSAYQAMANVYGLQGQKKFAETCKSRAEMIAVTQEIGEVMAGSTQRDGEQLSMLIEVLLKLNRPLEALAWRGVQVSYARQTGALSDSQATQYVHSLTDERKKLLRSNQYRPTERFILCGADPFILER